jgi:GNAT superfamily N-acetyltransferase
MAGGGRACVAGGGGGATWQAAVAADLSDIMAIAEVAHPDLPERPEVFAEKLRLFPPGGLVLAGAGGAALGYAIAHPWTLGEVPALDTLLGALPPAADALFLHDVSVLPVARGQGAAAALVGLLDGLARDRGLRALALVAVHGTEAMWARLGFRPRAGGEVAGYGAAARHMVRPVGTGPRAARTGE